MIDRNRIRNGPGIPLAALGTALGTFELDGPEIVNPPSITSKDGVLEFTLTAAPARVTVAGETFVSNVYNGRRLGRSRDRAPRPDDRILDRAPRALVLAGHVAGVFVAALEGAVRHESHEHAKG